MYNIVLLMNGQISLQLFIIREFPLQLFIIWDIQMFIYVYINWSCIKSFHQETTLIIAIVPLTVFYIHKLINEIQRYSVQSSLEPQPMCPMSKTSWATMFHISIFRSKSFNHSRHIILSLWPSHHFLAMTKLCVTYVSMCFSRLVLAVH